MTDNLHTLPAGNASDYALVHRLYDMARTGNCDPRELAMVDFLVYARLAEAYGVPPPPSPGDDRLMAA